MHFVKVSISWSSISMRFSKWVEINTVELSYTLELTSLRLIPISIEDNWLFCFRTAAVTAHTHIIEFSNGRAVLIFELFWVVFVNIHRLLIYNSRQCCSVSCDPVCVRGLYSLRICCWLLRLSSPFRWTYRSRRPWRVFVFAIELWKKHTVSCEEERDERNAHLIKAQNGVAKKQRCDKAVRLVESRRNFASWRTSHFACWASVSIPKEVRNLWVYDLIVKVGTLDCASSPMNSYGTSCLFFSCSILQYTLADLELRYLLMGDCPHSKCIRVKSG